MNGSLSQLLKGKKGLVMGVANDRSIAWTAAAAASRAGARLAFTYQNHAMARRVVPLAESLGAEITIPCDVADGDEIDSAFDTISEHWNSIDFVVHAIAFSDRNELKGRYVDASRENMLNSLLVSCYSFTRVAQRAASMANFGASLVTYTFEGSRHVVPSYNVMGVAKAALEQSVCYLAADLGSAGIRVNAISSGPMRTLSGAAIGAGRAIHRWARQNSALRRDLEPNDVANTSLYLLSELSSGVTGEVHHVDNGNNIVGVTPRGC